MRSSSVGTADVVVSDTREGRPSPATEQRERILERGVVRPQRSVQEVAAVGDAGGLIDDESGDCLRCAVLDGSASERGPNAERAEMREVCEEGLAERAMAPVREPL